MLTPMPNKHKLNNCFGINIWVTRLTTNCTLHTNLSMVCQDSNTLTPSLKNVLHASDQNRPKNLLDQIPHEKQLVHFRACPSRTLASLAQNQKIEIAKQTLLVSTVKPVGHHSLTTSVASLLVTHVNQKQLPFNGWQTFLKKTCPNAKTNT